MNDWFFLIMKVQRRDCSYQLLLFSKSRMGVYTVGTYIVASFLKTHRRTTMYLDKQEKGQNPNTWKISKTWGGWGCGGACSYCFNFTLTFLIFISILYTRKKYGGGSLIIQISYLSLRPPPPFDATRLV